MNINGVTQVQNDFQNGGYYKSLSFHDIISGTNGGFNASSGWDPVTGMGSFENYFPGNINVTTGATYSHHNYKQFKIF